MVVRQKGEFQNRGNKKTKHANFSGKRTFLTPWYAHVQKYAFNAFKKSFETLKRSEKKNVSWFISTNQPTIYN